MRGVNVLSGVPKGAKQVPMGVKCGTKHDERQSPDTDKNVNHHGRLLQQQQRKCNVQEKDMYSEEIELFHKSSPELPDPLA